MVFGCLLIIMLLTGINYQNSLIYLLTFVLGALFVAAMHQTHGNLAGFRLALVSVGEGYPGTDIAFRFRATASDQAYAIYIRPKGREAVQIHVAPAEIVEFEVPAGAERRGPVMIDQLRIETRFPFGLLKAWSWIRPQSSGWCYPHPVTPPYDVPGDSEGDNVCPVRSSEFAHAEIRPWRQGDLSQRVLWKRFARTGEMVIADWEGENGDPVWIDYDQYPGADRELRLSYLAALVEARSRANLVYGLHLPDRVIEPDQGPGHRQRCLQALAGFGFEPVAPATGPRSILTSRAAGRVS